MLGQESLLVTLVRLVDRLPVPPPPPKRRRGRPKVYADRLFLKALVIMIVRHPHTVHELFTVLDQPTPEMQVLRLLLTERGKFPARRTWERRLQVRPNTLPAQLGWLFRLPSAPPQLSDSRRNDLYLLSGWSYVMAFRAS